MLVEFLDPERPYLTVFLEDTEVIAVLPGEHDDESEVWLRADPEDAVTVVGTPAEVVVRLALASRGDGSAALHIHGAYNESELARRQALLEGEPQA